MRTSGFAVKPISQSARAGFALPTRISVARANAPLSRCRRRLIVIVSCSNPVHDDDAASTAVRDKGDAVAAGGARGPGRGASRLRVRETKETRRYDQPDDSER